MQHTTSETKLSIKDLSERERPREKLLEQGKNHLLDAELLAILIGSGNVNENAVQLSARILESVNGNLTELGKKSITDLRKFNGIGEAKALTIIAALELGRRRQFRDIEQRKQILTSNDMYESIFNELVDLRHEEFWIILLNQANHILKKNRIGVGGVSSTLADPKIILKSALDALASNIILIHNHPSGNLKPSDADIKLTEKLKKGCALLDIQVLDHLIVSHTGYYSFRDEGRL